MKDTKCDHQSPKLSCLEAELLVSKACDGECLPEELLRLKNHLHGCSRCRSLMREYLAVRDMMTLHVMNACCSVSKPILPKHSNILSMRTLRGYAAIIAASILFFVFGHHVGFVHAKRNLAVSVSPVLVATPSMWATNRPQNSGATPANVGSEQSFTNSIRSYRSAVGEELRKGNVDWLRVRELVEAMGELRTDLELLTLHMAYLDMRTGSSPSEIASHWETLGEIPDTVYKR